MEDLNNLNFGDFDVEEFDESAIDDMDLNSYGSVDTTISEKHLKMNTKEFKEALKIAKSVVATSAKDIISKAMCLKREGDKVKIYCTDFDVYLEQEIELLNTENILEESISFPVDVMMKLVKAVPSNIVIFKDEEGYKIKLVGGDVFLEVHSIDVDKFLCKDEFKDTAVNLEASELNAILRDFSPIVCSAVSPQERRIVFSDKAISTYMFSSIYSEGKYPTMDLKVKDINILKQLTNTEDVLKVKDPVNKDVYRKVIEGPNFKYTFLVSDLGINEQISSALDTLNFTDGFYVDYLQLYKTIELSSELNYSVGKVGLNFDDQFTLYFKTKKGKDTVFHIEGSKDGNVTPLKNNLEVQSKLLKVLLRCFSKESSIKIGLQEDVLLISTDNYKAVLFISTR